MDQQYSSILLENAVNEFAKLPGIGRKTALRLVLHLLRQEEGEAEKFGNTIIKLCKEIKRCHICHNISDSDTCTICGDPSRDASTLCVVENVKEVMVVENTRQFHGLYHVLGGGISITRQIDQVPTIIDKKMIDKHRLSRSRRGHRQPFLTSQHIYQRRLSHIGTSDKSIFG